MKEHEMEAEDLKFSPEHLAKLIDLADAGIHQQFRGKRSIRADLLGRY